MAAKYGINDIMEVEEIRKSIQLISKDIENLNTQLKNTGMKDLIKIKTQLAAAEKTLEIEQKKRLQLEQSLDLQTQKGIAETKAKQKAVRDLANETVKATQIEKGYENAMEMTIKSEKDLIVQTNALVAKRKILDTTTEKGKKEFQELSEKIKQNTQILKQNDSAIDRHQRNVGNYPSLLGGMKSALSSIGPALLAAFSFQAIKSFFTMTSESYNQSVINETKLRTVLAERTTATEKQIQSVLDLAAAEMERGVIEDDIQIAGAQQLATFVKNTDAIVTLLPLMNDLNAQQNGVNATEESAVKIGNLFGKVLDGNAGALKKMGISFSEEQTKMLKFGNEQERVATLAEVIKNNVGNMNEALAQTDAGKILNFKNNLGNLMETIGKDTSAVTAELAAWGNAVLKSITEGNALTAVFKNFWQIIKDLFTPLEKMFSQLGTGGDKLSFLNGIFKVLSVTMQIALAPMEGLLWVFTKLFNLIANTGVVEKAINVFAYLFNLFEKTPFYKIIAGLVDIISDLYTTISNLDGVKSAIALFERFFSLFSDQKKTNAELRAESKARMEEEKRAHYERMRNLDKSISKSEEETEIINKNTKAIEKNNKEKNKTVNDIKFTAPKTLDFIDPTIKTPEEIAKEQSDFENRQKYLSELFQEAQNVKKEIAIKNGDDIAKLEKTQALEKAKFDVQQAELYLKLRQTTLKNIEPLEAQGLQTTLSALRVKLAEEEANINGTENKTKFIAKLLGISDEDVPKVIDAANQVLQAVLSAVDQELEARKQAAEETIQLSEQKQKTIEDEIAAENKRTEEIKRAHGTAYTNRKDQLEKELALEKQVEQRAITERRKAANQQKAIDLAQAQIAGSVAILNGLKTQPLVPFGFIMAGLAGIAAATQIGLIAKTKYEKGGSFIMGGKYHSEGGNDLGENREGEKGEAVSVFSREATKNNYPLIKNFTNFVNSNTGKITGITPVVNFVNDNSKSDKYLSEIAKNTAVQISYNSKGQRIEKNGNTTTLYN